MYFDNKLGGEGKKYKTENSFTAKVVVVASLCGFNLKLLRRRVFIRNSIFCPLCPLQVSKMEAILKMFVFFGVVCFVNGN